MSTVLMWPFILIGKHRPSGGVPYLDYAWMFLLGSALGALVFSAKHFVVNKMRGHVTE